MAYQDIRRSVVLPTEIIPPSGPMTDKGIRDAFAQIFRVYSSLAQEVMLCHNSIQQFSITIANGLTTASAIFPAPTKTTNYIAVLSPEFNSGGPWITSKTTTGCSMSWITATVGSQTMRILIVE